MERTFLDFCRGLEDPRIEGMVTYPLAEVMLSALVGVLCGADDFEEIDLCASEKLEVLRRYLPYACGVAPEQTLRRVFRALDGQAFQEAFSAWMRGFSGSVGRGIALDGKTLRGSADAGKGEKALHLVSAFAHDAGLVLGQQAVGDKSNEIKAIPQLLDRLCLTDAIVTIDAMGTQKEIAAAIVAKGGDYVLALKGNQGTLQEDVALFFETPDPDADGSEHSTLDAGHGRIEERQVLAIEPGDWLNKRHPGWPTLRSIVQVTARRTLKASGATSVEKRLYLSSLPADAALLSGIIRHHWRIENVLHWSLDVTFRDDLCRSRADNAALNFAIVKHTAFNALKRCPEKISLKNKRKKAALNNNFLSSLVNYL